MIDLKRRTFLGWLSAGAAGAFVYFRTSQVVVSEMLLHDVPGALKKHKVLFLTPEARRWAERRGVKGFEVTPEQARSLWSVAARRKVKDGRTH